MDNLHKPETMLETAEDVFEEMLKRIDNPTKQTDGFKKIIELVDEEGDYDKGIKLLKAFIERRESSLDQFTSPWTNQDININPDAIRNVVIEIRIAMSNTDAFLGNGSVADVFTLRNQSFNQDRWICAKVVSNYARYSEGVLTTQEISFLDMLRKISVRGVRTPVPYFVFSGIGMDGIVMEHLDAFNFRRIIEKQTTEGIKDKLPQGFDVDDYFDRLLAYVVEMHKMGILHGDLHLRNLMIDRKTNMPYLIDFGKAKFAWQIDKTRMSVEDLQRNDLESLRLAKIEAKQWIKKYGTADKPNTDKPDTLTNHSS